MDNVSHYRPCGPLRQVFRNLHEHQFGFLGCVGTEDRCVAAYDELSMLGVINKSSLVEITDVQSEHTPRCVEKRQINRRFFVARGVNDDAIVSLNLLENEEEIIRWVEDFVSVDERIVLDISSLPKRFFFPAVKLLMRNPAVLDLVITYSVAEEYHNGNIAERPSDWRALPLFGSPTFPEPKYQLAIVGVGFLPFGLPDLLKSGFLEARPHLFFPFPASPATYSKTWDFVRQIEGSLSLTLKEQLVQVDAMDPSDTFNHILWLTENGLKNVIFAPYGPKPMSLGMAIYATITGSPVFYTQPRIYHPDYSIGVRTDNGIPVVHAYCLKLDGRNLYAI